MESQLEQDSSIVEEQQDEATPAEAPAETSESAEPSTPTVDEVTIVLADAVAEPPREGGEGNAALKAVIEAAIYITDEPLTPEQIAVAMEQPLDVVKTVLNELVSDYAAPDRGLSIRELAGGYKMSTKVEHHESIRRFVKKLQPPLKLSLAALESLAVIAYKQPITAPEIMDIRGVQGAGVLKTLLDRKLIATAGRKNVLGKPMLYRTTKEFLIQFGLSSLAELPTLKEFEELGRLAFSDSEELAPQGRLIAQPPATVGEKAAGPVDDQQAEQAIDQEPQPADETAAGEADQLEAQEVNG